MEAKDHVRRHREALEAWNRRDFDAVVADYGEDIEVTDHAQQQTMKSADAVRSWNMQWADAFSDGRIEIIDVLAAGDWTVARFVGRGTNDGQLAGMQATNRGIQSDYCDMVRWEDDKIVEQHIYYDLYGILSQLGHVPALSEQG